MGCNMQKYQKNFLSGDLYSPPWSNYRYHQNWPPSQENPIIYCKIIPFLPTSHICQIPRQLKRHKFSPHIDAHRTASQEVINAFIAVNWVVFEGSNASRTTPIWCIRYNEFYCFSECRLVQISMNIQRGWKCWSGGINRASIASNFLQKRLISKI